MTAKKLKKSQKGKANKSDGGLSLLDQILLDQDDFDMSDIEVTPQYVDDIKEGNDNPPKESDDSQQASKEMIVEHFDALVKATGDDLPIKSPSLDDLDYAILDWLTKHNSLDAEVKAAITRVLDDSVIKIRVFMYALAQHKIKRMLYLFSKLAKIEDKMFSDEKLDSEVIPLKDLFKMFSLISSEISKYSDFLKNLPAPDKNVYGILLDPDDEETLGKLPQESREKIKKVLKKLLT